MSSTKSILFDWDGVICDSFGVFHSIHNRLYPSANMGMDDFRKYFSNRSYEGKGVLPGRLMDYSSDFCSASLFPCMCDVLVKLKGKGKKLTLISNSPIGVIQYHLEKNKLKGVFDALYTSDHALRKPNPQLLEDIHIKFGTGEKETVFIGDQVSDLLFVKDKKYKKFFCTYGFSDYTELSRTEIQFNISDVLYYRNSMDLAFALNQLD